MKKNIEIKIDTNIPLPTTALKGSYPFDKMKIGDSFFVSVSGKHVDSTSLRNSLGGLGRKYSKNKWEGKVKFTTRIEKNGVRIWRVE